MNTPQPVMPHWTQPSRPANPLRIDAAGATLTGQRRRNEDRFELDQQRDLYLVADGMGGMLGGDRAAQLVVNAISTWIATGPTEPDEPDEPDELGELGELGEPDELESAIRFAHERLLEAILATPNAVRMGTTIVALKLDQAARRAAVAHVGDSRAYRLREGKLERLTVDHNIPGDLLSAGRLTEAQAARHPLRNVLTRCVSAQPLDGVDVSFHDVEAGDRFLICSDGLTVTLDDDAIEAHLRSNDAPETVANRLLRTAERRGASDNVTLVLVAVR